MNTESMLSRIWLSRFANANGKPNRRRNGSSEKRRPGQYRFFTLMTMITPATS